MLVLLVQLMLIFFSFQMKKKYAYPSVDAENVFPEGLKKLATHAGIFGQRPDKNHHLDSDTLQILSMPLFSV